MHILFKAITMFLYSPSVFLIKAAISFFRLPSFLKKYIALIFVLMNWLLKAEVSSCFFRIMCGGGMCVKMYKLWAVHHHPSPSPFLSIYTKGTILGSHYLQVLTMCPLCRSHQGDGYFYNREMLQ